MDVETTRLIKQSVPLYTTLATALLVLTLAAILRLGSDVFVPVALATLMSFLLAPAVRALQRLGLPQGVSVLLTVLAAFAAFAGLFVLVGTQLAALGADLPRYQGTIRDKIGALGGLANPGGTLSRAIEAMTSVGRDLNGLGGSPAGGGGSLAGPTDRGPARVILEDGGGLLGTLGLYVSPILHPLATTALVIILVVFILAAREDLRNRFIRLLGTDDIQHTTAVIDDAARRLSRLFLMQLALNAGFGSLVGIGVWTIGIPSPVLWGVLAGVLRFVPYVGAIVGALPPLALAIAVDPGWSMLLWTALLFAALEAAIGQVLEPLLFGHSTGLSPIAVILSATVWTFLWGPIGLVMATPLTVCIVVLGRHVSGLGFLDLMLGNQPGLSPPQIFYQRMLAGDPSEAILQAKQFLRERALSTYLDEVALEALRLAHEDVARARLTPERQEVIRKATDGLIDHLASLDDPRPRGGQVSAEAAAAVMAAGPDRGAATRVLTHGELRPDWQGRAPVLCFAKPGTLDEVIAKMLTQVLTKHGIPARSLGDETAGSCQVNDVETDVRLVCLSYLEPLSTLHLRHAVRLARRTFPNAKVMIGFWRERDAAMGNALGRAARADAVASTLGSALSTIVELATAPQDRSISLVQPRSRAAA